MNLCIFLTTLFLALSSRSAAYAKSVILADLSSLQFSEENGILAAYTQDRKPFSGAVIQPDAYNRKITYFYKDGLKNGVAISHYPDGKPELQIMYSNGKKNGSEILLSTQGLPVYKRQYQDDILEGEEVLYYTNGKPRQLNVYHNGKLHGECRTFAENGNQTLIVNYSDGHKNGIERIIENNILRQENNYKKGVLDGLSKTYNSKYLEAETVYHNNIREGLSTTYAQDGSYQKIPYHNDKINGLKKSYTATKVIQAAENYMNNLQHGISRYFSERGNLVQVKMYSNNVLTKQVDIMQYNELKNIYISANKGQLSNFSNRKELWYLILWLGLSTEQENIITTLSKEMKMYAAEISDISIYKKYSGNKFKQYNNELFFGLTPLSYLVNIDASDQLLQYFISQINLKNADGTTALEQAKALNNQRIVNFLLQHKATKSTNF